MSFAKLASRPVRCAAPRRASLAVLSVLTLACSAGSASAVVVTALNTGWEFTNAPVVAVGAGPLFTNGQNPFTPVNEVPNNPNAVPGLAGAAFPFSGLGAWDNAPWSQGVGPLPFLSNNPAAAPNQGGRAGSAVATVSTFLGGGGVFFTRALADSANPAPVAAGRAIANITSVAARFQNPANVAVTLQTGSFLAMRGTLQANSFGMASLRTQVNAPLAGVSVILPDLFFAVENFAGVTQAFIFNNGNLATAVLSTNNPVGVFQLTATSSLAISFNPATGVSSFSVFGLSLGPIATFPAIGAPVVGGAPIDVVATLGVISDPGTFDWDLTAIPDGFTLPEIGAVIPTPGAATLLALGGLVAARRRRA